MRPRAVRDKAKTMLEAEGKLRVIFWGSLVLCALLVIHIVYLAGRAGGVLATVQSFLPAVLLWALVLTGYAFHSLSKISGEKRLMPEHFTDEVTGVFSLPYLKSWLEQDRERAFQTGLPTTVAYVDLQNLERVNREFGHAVGDIVLRAVAQLMASKTRRGDIVGRVGGDEFLVVMPETGLPQARTVVESMQEAVRGYRLDLGKRGIIDFLSCLVGTAVFPTDAEAPDSIVAAARANLSERLPAT